MIDEILPGLYRIVIPLPASPLKDLNSYVIKSDDRNLIIDTGFNRSVCWEAMEKGLKELRIDLSRTDFMLTHMHSDHTGLVSRLFTDTSRVFFSAIDAKVFDMNLDWQPIVDYAVSNGFQLEELIRAAESHPGFKYSPKRIPEFTLIGHNDYIRIGNYNLRCIHTPGHTEGHICLYDEAKKIFFSGDHVLYDITPHIESWSPQINALKDYLESLDKVKDLPVSLVLPGHRRFFTDLKSRIEEIKKHHEARAREVLDVLGAGTLNAYDIASKMIWDIDCENWEDFPPAQKWFAVGEAIAHLQYLEEKSKVKRIITGKYIAFSAA
jgi:glyoxylase-like metal-dependent hydrolase (beta-lactamase superfamily II)